MRNDKQTHARLIKALYHRERMAKRPKIGVVDTALDTRLTQLAARYNARQQKVRSSTLLRVTTGVSDATKAVMDQLKALISGPQVGALPLAVVVPVALVAVAGLSYLVYKAFSEDEARSVQDVIEAAHLSQVYQNMDETEKRFFDEETKKAAEAGARDAKKGSLKNILLAAGAGALVVAYLNRSER